MKFIQDLFKSKERKIKEKCDNMTSREKIEYIIHKGLNDGYYYPVVIQTDKYSVVIVVNRHLGFIRVKKEYNNIVNFLEFSIDTSPEIIYSKIFPNEYRQEQFEKAFFNYILKNRK